MKNLINSEDIFWGIVAAQEKLRFWPEKVINSCG